MKKRVTIQGVKGCFHDAAARAYFAGEDVDSVPCETFPSMFETLKTDASLIGIVAIENTIAGSLLQNHELLRLSGLTVVGEYKLIKKVTADVEVLSYNTSVAAFMICL